MAAGRTDYILWAALTLGVFASLAGAVLLMSPHVLLAGVAISAAAALLIRFGDWVVPALMTSAGAHPVYRDVELVDDAVLFMEESGEWVATGFVVMDIQASPLEEGEKQQLMYLSLLSNFYTHLPDDTVISMYLAPVDIDAYRAKLKTEYHLVLQDLQRAQSEGKTSLERQLKMKLQELERQLRSLETDRPVDVSFVARVSARSPSRDVALRMMRERRNRLESVVRGVLRVGTRAARGGELASVMRITMTMPDHL